MSFTQLDANIKEPLACIGTAKILTRKNETLGVYPGENGPAPGTDRNGRPMINIAFRFDPLVDTTGPTSPFGHTWYCCVSPAAFDPNAGKKQMEAVEKYQKNNFNSFLTLCELALGAEGAATLYKKLYDLSDVTLNPDGSITDNTPDWQAVAHAINEAFDNTTVGFCLQQKSEKVMEDGKAVVDENGKSIYRKVNAYELQAHDRFGNCKFFAYDPDGNMKPPKGYKPTFQSIIPF